ncbi:hypothetical protein PoB_006139600 [Plakobranchus ocellatus]|uniref:Uncharacterized protein n=1 Tax=Plakobranchus ocellatus TaxID=259542 RepID=A0AAV4CT30_9GAST|nr:hypothetical protein PoB_006139600 [Plakobranchus ocellatus]
MFHISPVDFEVISGCVALAWLLCRGGLEPTIERYTANVKANLLKTESSHRILYKQPVLKKVNSYFQALGHGQGAGDRARTRDRKVPADLRADSLSTVPPTLHHLTGWMSPEASDIYIISAEQLQNEETSQHVHTPFW